VKRSEAQRCQGCAERPVVTAETQFSVLAPVEDFKGVLALARAKSFLSLFTKFLRDRLCL
jgi:hypothetical protein